MESGMLAHVAIEKAAYGFDKLFSYSVPDGLAESVLPGCRVTVMFGAANVLRQGFVFDVVHEKDGGNIPLKPILAVLDTIPALSAELIELACWLREHTFCTYFEAARAMLPRGVCMQTTRCYRILPGASEDVRSLSDDERKLLIMLEKRQEFIPERKLLKGIGYKTDDGILRGLERKKRIESNRAILPGSGEKSVSLLRLTDEELEAEDYKLSARQTDVYHLLRDVGTASVKELCYYTGASSSVVATLIKKGAIESFMQNVDRSLSASFRANEPYAVTGITLSAEQKKALECLYAAYVKCSGQTALLYGVTGSGKTAVYLSLIDRVLQDGKNIIVMVPEISLTPQTLAVFSARYGALTAVFHSGLSVGERYDEWIRVKNGEARIVVGTRSAVFAPLTNIGLVVMDEEQEHTYKSEMSPRYHARDVARFRCAYNHALLLLASATPSVESFAAARSGKYLLCSLPGRYGKAQLPSVTTIDMTDKTLRDPYYILSRPLADAIGETLEQGKQTMLLMNRRGYNTFVVCSSCKKVVTCPSCSISMTYHSANNRLMCHYCGFSMPFTDTCPDCGEKNIRYAGFGTQRLEEELHARFPAARIQRLDADTVTEKNSYERVLNAFARNEYDILLGTQMIAKGLDFPAVTLVGVVSVDQQLYNDDYRASEKIFDLLTQVIGRAGRAEAPGRAIVQTLVPDNGILQLAARQDYIHFYEDEIALRKAMIYPPFCDICLVGFSGEKEGEVQRAAGAFLLSLIERNKEPERAQKVIVLGPLPPRIPKIGGRYRQKLLIKCRNSESFRSFLSALLKDFINNKEYKKINVFADINPVSAF